jgi:GTP-binding protein EngB required for normal cell division
VNLNPTSASPDPGALRALTSQLAEDLSWLEDHCRRRLDPVPMAAELRLAAALVRNLIGPFLDDQPRTPLHVAVVGGAGVGKSTVANFLSGAHAAETNPQAGFTRHPVAYTNANGTLNWPAHLGFLGPLQRLVQPCPSNLDEDVYQVRRVPLDPHVSSLLKDFVVWDCPDMTTWAATGYIPRLLEVTGLADIIVYVASDERYNDEVPTQFLQLLLRVGKPVLVVLTKMREADAPALVAHFQREVLAKVSGQAVATLPVPFLTPEQVANPVSQAAKQRIPLLNQVAVLADPGARVRAVRGAMRYLAGAEEQLLAAARQDVAALQTWRDLVQAGQIEFDHRYRTEYLAGERFRGFDEALVRLMELLELPGVGKVVSGALWVVRAPYRLLKGLAVKAFSRPPTATLPEQPVLKAALKGWLDMLHKEAARRAGTHPLWAHLDKGFATGLAELAQDRFQQGFQGFQLGLANEVERTARDLYEELEKNPVKLNMLRGFKLTLDAGAIGLAVAAGGLNWHDFILVPLAAAVTQQLVELLGKQYVDNERELARKRQQMLVTQYISGPLAEWLAQWPATGGSTFERLQLALRRIPAAVRQLESAVAARAS